MALSSEVKIQNLLNAVTDALLHEESDLDSIIGQYDVPHGEVTGFVSIIRRLHYALTGVEPSKAFVHRLQSDLLGARQVGLVMRVRHLPARVHVAAIVTVIAGFMLFARRRLTMDALREIEEAPALR